MSKIKQLMKTIKLKLSRPVENLGVGFFFILTFFIKFCLKILTYKYTIPHRMDVKFGIYRNLMLILSDAQLTNLERKRTFTNSISITTSLF